MKLIIFDMDGTLIDTGVIISNTINFVRKNIGLKEMSKKDILTNVNNPNINPAMFFYENHYFTDKHTELFENYYAQHQLSDLKVYDGIRELLEELSGEFELAVATNASKISAQNMLSHTNLKQYFKSIASATCVENPKPKPDMILKIMLDLSISPSNTILIGDSYKDIYAANNANIKSILINWGFSQHNEAVNDIQELRSKIKKWENE